MNNLTRFFLVLLRLAIGWHFFFEGLEKFDSLRTGPTITNRPFTSASYLKEASGPFANFFRNQAGDTDEDVLSRLTVVPLAPGQDAAKIPPHTRMPPQLAQEWKDFFDRFVQHYHLDQQQAALAEKKLQQREDQTVQWLLEGRKKVTKTFPSGTVEVEKTNPQRIEDYRNKVQEVGDLEDKLIKSLGKDVLKEKLRTAKAEVNQMRLDLLGDLKEQTVCMRKALEEVVPAAVASIPGVSTVGLSASPLGAAPLSASAAVSVEKGQEILTPEQKNQRQPMLETSVAAEKALVPLATVDYLVTYGLMVIGICLLLGLFSRTACLAGAIFLLMLYLAMPPFPWLPDPPRPTEGHYLFVSKNLIEMIALLALATTRSGCWAGLDGLLQFLNPWRRRSRQRSEVRVQTSDVRRYQPTSQL